MSSSRSARQAEKGKGKQPVRYGDTNTRRSGHEANINQLSQRFAKSNIHGREDDTSLSTGLEEEDTEYDPKTHKRYSTKRIKPEDEDMNEEDNASYLERQWRRKARRLQISRDREVHVRSVDVPPAPKRRRVVRYQHKSKKPNAESMTASDATDADAEETTDFGPEFEDEWHNRAERLMADLEEPLESDSEREMYERKQG